MKVLFRITKYAVVCLDYIQNSDVLNGSTVSEHNWYCYEALFYIQLYLLDNCNEPFILLYKNVNLPSFFSSLLTDTVINN